MNIPIQFWTAIIAVLGTVLVTWFGSHLNQRQAEKTAKRQEEREDRRFRAQRLWDAKKQAYSEILKETREWFVAWNSMHHGFNGEDASPHSYNESKALADQEARADEAVRARNEAFDRNMLVLSDEFIAAFIRLRDDVDAIEWYDPPTLAQDLMEYSKRVFDELLEIARRELAN